MARLPNHQKHQPHSRRWKRYEKPQPGHRLQLDVKFLERIVGLCEQRRANQVRRGGRRKALFSATAAISPTNPPTSIAPQEPPRAARYTS